MCLFTKHDVVGEILKDFSDEHEATVEIASSVILTREFKVNRFRGDDRRADESDAM